MSNIMKFPEKDEPWVVSEMICLKCLERAIVCRLERLQQKRLECKCGEIGFMIETGEILPDDCSYDIAQI